MEIKFRNNLVDALKELNLPLVVAEIGVAEGLFSRDMAAKGLDRLYCVDFYGQIPDVSGDGNSAPEWHNHNMQEARDRLNPWKGKVTWLRGLSPQMAEYVPEESLGMLYLDGDHSYGGVMADLAAWYAKVVPGGIIAGHDYLNESYGVKKAIDVFCEYRKHEVHLIAEFKEEDAGFWFLKTKAKKDG